MPLLFPQLPFPYPSRRSGKCRTAKRCRCISLKNANGMEVNIITYGGAVQSIMMPDKNGHVDDVALGFDNLDGYLHTEHLFGALIGRYANRIADGKFTLDGKTYSIPINNAPNALHGGPEGFNTQGLGSLEDRDARRRRRRTDFVLAERPDGLSGRSRGHRPLYARQRQRPAHPLFGGQRPADRHQPHQPHLFQPRRRRRLARCSTRWR